MLADLSNTIATIIGIIMALLGAFLFAFWVAMGIWAFNDIRSRTRDWLAIALASMLVLVFPLVGLVLYMMVRPKESLADVFDRALEEESLLRELEGGLVCHRCGMPVQEHWNYCPHCHAQLRYACPTCGEPVRHEWSICVSCGSPLPDSPPTAAPPAIAMEREEPASPSSQDGAAGNGAAFRPLQESAPRR